MKFTFYHNNINVLDLEKSVAFYQKALGLAITREKEADDGSFKLVFLGMKTLPICWNLPGSEIWTGLITWVTTNSILPCGQMTWTRHMRFMKRWAASALRILIWESISSATRTDTGSRSARPDNESRLDQQNAVSGRLCF